MSSGMFRGKESSNRIELSRLVQDLLNFSVLGSLQLWGSGEGGWGWGWLGGAPHTHAHACTCTHMHAGTCARGKHDNFMQMAAPIGESLRFPYDVILVHACVCVCVCACMCTCVESTLSPPHTHIHPPPPGGTPGISQNSIALELIEIFQFRLKI